MGTLDRQIELLQFQAAHRNFCVDVDQVLGVITLPPAMGEVPSLVPFQDRNIPVLSLDRLLECEEPSSRTPKEIIILAGAEGDYGISVDWIGQIHKVAVQRSVFRFLSSRSSRVRMFGVWGVARLGGEPTLILEPERLPRPEQGPVGEEPRPSGARSTTPSFPQRTV